MFVTSVHTSDGCGSTTGFVFLTCVALNGTEVLTSPLYMHTMSVTNSCICSHCSAQTLTIATRITTTRIVVTCVVEGFRVNLVVAGSEQLFVVDDAALFMRPLFPPRFNFTRMFLLLGIFTLCINFITITECKSAHTNITTRGRKIVVLVAVEITTQSTSFVYDENLSYIRSYNV
jgi:hypothetical protein